LYIAKELEDDQNDDCLVFEQTKIRIYWFRKRESSSPPKKGKQPKAHIFPFRVRRTQEARAPINFSPKASLFFLQRRENNQNNTWSMSDRESINASKAGESSNKPQCESAMDGSGTHKKE
jgi:hypothetical protein